MTRYEKIKQMSIEEMAQIIKSFHCPRSLTRAECLYISTVFKEPDCDCELCIRRWLESEVEE